VFQSAERTDCFMIIISIILDNSVSCKASVYKLVGKRHVKRTPELYAFEQDVQ